MPTILAAQDRFDARREAKAIRTALESNSQYVWATDARDGKEYRIVDASVTVHSDKVYVVGQDIRQGIWFPITKWEQR